MVSLRWETENNLKDRQESVLFEDTASISYLKASNPNPLYVIGGLIIGIILGLGYRLDDLGIVYLLVFGPFILAIILTL